MNKHILILKFPYSSVYGGGEKHTLELFQELEKQEISFSLVSSCPILLKLFKQHGYSTQYFWAGVEPVSIWSIILFPFLAPFVFIGLVFMLFYYKFSKRVDTLYCLSLTEKLLLAPIAKLIGMKVLFIEHVSIQRWLSKNPFRFLYLWWSNFAQIITVSMHIKKQLVKMGVKEERIHVIYNGVNLNKFYLQENLLEHIQDLGHQKPKTFNVGTVARLDEEKGISYLIRAGKIALEYIPNLRIIIIGTGPEKENLIWLAKNLGMETNVQFVGFREDLLKWLTNLDVFVLPSVKRESFGMAAAEAMACAKPVIASRIGGLTELIEHKKTGILIEPKDFKTLASEIIHLSQDPQECVRIGIEARKRVEQLFSHEMMVRQYLQVIVS